MAKPGHQRRGRSHDGQCPPRRAGPEAMGELMGQNQVGWTCMEPSRSSILISFFHICRNRFRGVETCPGKSRVGSQASGAFVLYQVCSEYRPFTRLENPAPCPQAAYSPIGETRQWIEGLCITSRYVGITKESLPLQAGTSRQR